MSARNNDDRRIAEMYETIESIQRRMREDLTRDKVLRPQNMQEERDGLALAYSLQRVAEEVTGLSYEVIIKYDHIPWDSIRGMRNILSHDYPGLNWDQIWDTAENDLPVVREFCLAYAKDRGTTIEGLIEENHSVLRANTSRAPRKSVSDRDQPGLG